jgi:hypothetical protein
MTDDSGNLSIDFLAGFAIFMISFIWIATMVPGLFIGISSHTIDYDAVAYRTGVILAEDPGAAGVSGIIGPQGVLPWEFQPNKLDVSRFGLSVSKETPNILDENKVNRFFCSTVFSYPQDYQKRAIFGDYPYRFNISLRTVGDDQIRSVGDIVPADYGYIRREVKIKRSSNATIDDAMIKAHRYYNTENVTFNRFSIAINASALISGSMQDPRYQINPLNDRILINITDLDKTRPVWNPLPALPVPPGTNLTRVDFYQLSSGGTSLSFWSPPNGNFIYEDGNATPVKPPVAVRNSISLIFGPEFFNSADPRGTMYVNLTFGLDPPSSYLNNTLTTPFDYNYNPANVTQPALEDGVMEVAVW